MPGGRQHLKSHRYTSGCAYQVQPPTVERPPLGSAPADVVMGTGQSSCSSVYQLAASACPHHLTHRNRHTVHDEGFPLSIHLSDEFHYVLQPPLSSQGVQPPAEAGDAQRFGNVAHTFHHEQG